MPIYEYVCRDCGKRFEALVRASTPATCPSCQGSRLEQQFSVFAVGGERQQMATREAPGPCGTCGDPRGPGSCSIN